MAFSLRRHMMLSFVAGMVAIMIATSTCQASTVLSPGDVAVVGMATDAPDTFAFVNFVPLTAGTTIFFTDDGYACSGFRGFESEMRYVASADVPAGTVVEWDETAPEWTLVSGSMSLSTTADQILVYQGSKASPSFVWALDLYGSWISNADCATADQYTTTLPPGLTDGVNAVTWLHTDNVYYRPYFATSAPASTLAKWMTMNSRFIRTSSLRADYVLPASFRILAGAQFGVNNYAEYIPGDAPIILSSPHGGDLFPASITNRTHGCWNGAECTWDPTCSPQDSVNCRAVTSNDQNTQDITRRLADAYEALTGARPHVVVNRLGRIKHDANREINEACMGDAGCEQAWNEFHNFMTDARNSVEASTCAKGLVLDVHGHTHPTGRVEFGYKLSASNLDLPDVDLDALASTCSFYSIATTAVSGASLSELVRGTDSLGALVERASPYNASGYISVPSPTLPTPGSDAYFQGGYDIERHGSEGGGSIDGVQMEMPRWLRAEDYDALDDYISHLALALRDFVSVHYGFAGGVCPAPPPAPSNSPSPSPSPAAPPPPAPSNSPSPSPTPAPAASQVPFETLSATLSTASWTALAFSGSYTWPVVVCTPQLVSQTAEPVVVRIDTLGSSGCSARLFAASAGSPPTITATTSCIVVEEGAYTVASHGVKMEAVRYTSTVVDSKCCLDGESQTLANSYTSPVVLGQVLTSTDTAFQVFWSRGASRQSLPANGAFYTGRHAGEDPTTSRADEDIGFIVMESGAGSFGDSGPAYTAGITSASIKSFESNKGSGVDFTPASGLPPAPSVGIATQTAMRSADGSWAAFASATPISGNTITLTVDEDTLKDSERRHGGEYVAFLVL